jgi:hypothetical protein
MRKSLLLVLGACCLLAGCGGSSSTPQVPTVQAAETFQLANFTPDASVRAGKPTTVSFAITQPDGKPLTRYKRGGGPHTGVHLIVVSDDLTTMVHRHPPIGSDGTLRERFVLPRPGKYRVVVDAYPQGQPNFQLFRSIGVSGSAKPKPLPPFSRTVDADGYRVTLRGNPRLRAIQPGFLDITVTEPRGKPARFSPWYGALAHAIFFKAGTLDYFHTHVCAPGASGCTSTLGGARVSGRSTTPGKLRVGVLVPVAGTWRLFLQTRVDGHVITVPFTLEVK